MAKAQDNRSQDFTVLDWVGTSMSAMGVVFLLLWPWTFGRALRSMLTEFGGPLPGITLFAVGNWLAPLLGAMSGVFVAGGCFRTSLPLKPRRALVVVGFLVGVGGIALCVWAAYLPILSIAGTVKG